MWVCGCAYICTCRSFIFHHQDTSCLHICDTHMRLWHTGWGGRDSSTPHERWYHQPNWMRLDCPRILSVTIKGVCAHREVGPGWFHRRWAPLTFVKTTPTQYTRPHTQALSSLIIHKTRIIWPYFCKAKELDCLSQPIREDFFTSLLEISLVNLKLILILVPLSYNIYRKVQKACGETKVFHCVTVSQCTKLSGQPGWQNCRGLSTVTWEKKNTQERSTDRERQHLAEDGGTAQKGKLWWYFGLNQRF